MTKISTQDIIQSMQSIHTSPEDLFKIIKAAIKEVENCVDIEDVVMDSSHPFNGMTTEEALNMVVDYAIPSIQVHIDRIDEIRSAIHADEYSRQHSLRMKDVI